MEDDTRTHAPIPTLDRLHKHAYTSRRVLLSHLQERFPYTQAALHAIAYSFHQCGMNLLTRDGRIADCILRYSRVVRPFSSLVCLVIIIDKSLSTIYRLLQVLLQGHLRLPKWNWKKIRVCSLLQSATSESLTVNLTRQIGMTIQVPGLYERPSALSSGRLLDTYSQIMSTHPSSNTACFSQSTLNLLSIGTTIIFKNYSFAHKYLHFQNLLSYFLLWCIC